MTAVDSMGFSEIGFPLLRIMLYCPADLQDRA
jgi:hypothetical protein